MNETLYELFNLYKHLRSVQEIVNEILLLQNCIDNYTEFRARQLIDFCITKYDYQIRRIGSLYENKVVIDDDPHIYEKKDDVEIHGDVEYIRDCLIIIGAVMSGIRPSIESVVDEMYN